MHGVRSAAGAVGRAPGQTVAGSAAAGSESWSLSIPNTTALNGTHLYQQAFAVEPGVNAGGLITSNAIDFAVGIR